MNTLYPLCLTPIYKQYIWGGRRFAERLERPLSNTERYAESWEVADHPNGRSMIENGPLSGTSLSEVVAEQGDLLFGSSSDTPTQFPVLIKLLDATKNLSVQVHPSDEIAARLGLEDPRGKTEAWLVMDAEPGSRIWAGFNQKMTRAMLEESLREGEFTSLLHSFEPQVGDCIFIPAGTVHALGAGVMIAEVQQMSDTTFRISDWGRLGNDGLPRQLHVEQALESIDLEQGVVQPVRPRPVGDAAVVGWSSPPDETERLIQCPYFEINRFQVGVGAKYEGDGSCRIWTVLTGSGRLEHPAIAPINLSIGTTVVIPAVMDSIALIPSHDDPIRIMDARLPL